jgi:hypothetical protein
MQGRVGRGCDLPRPSWIRVGYRAMYVRGPGREGGEDIGEGKAIDGVHEAKPEAGAEDAGRNIRRGLRFPESIHLGREIIFAGLVWTVSLRLRLCLSHPTIREVWHWTGIKKDGRTGRSGRGQLQLVDSPHGLLDGDLGDDAQGGNRGSGAAGFVRGSWPMGRGAAENSAHHVAGATDGARIASGIRQDGEVSAGGVLADLQRQSSVLLRYIDVDLPVAGGRAEMRLLHQYQWEHSVKINAEHLPSALNLYADRLSRHRRVYDFLPQLAGVLESCWIGHD